MSPAELEAKLMRGVFSDMFIPGFLDQDETPVRFCALRTTLYIESGDSLIELRAVGTTGTMALTWASSVGTSSDLDEDMLAAATSIRQQILNDADGRNELSAIRLWNMDVRDGELVCGAMQLDLANGQQIFIDPTYHFGMRVGGSEQRAIWLENQTSSPAERIIQLASERS